MLGVWALGSGLVLSRPGCTELLRAEGEDMCLKPCTSGLPPEQTLLCCSARLRSSRVTSIQLSIIKYPYIILYLYVLIAHRNKCVLATFLSRGFDEVAIQVTRSGVCALSLEQLQVTSKCLGLHASAAHGLLSRWTPEEPILTAAACRKGRSSVQDCFSLQASWLQLRAGRSTQSVNPKEHKTMQ